MKCESRVKLADIVIEIKQRVEFATISICINGVNAIAEEENNGVLFERNARLDPPFEGRVKASYVIINSLPRRTSAIYGEDSQLGFSYTKADNLTLPISYCLFNIFKTSARGRVFKTPFFSSQPRLAVCTPNLI